MALTVLQVAYPHARVSRDAVGGAEQVLVALDRGLVAAGHRSIVVARAGSRVAGRLVPLPAEDGPIDDAARARAQAAVRAAIAAVRARERVDVVHLHGIDCAAYLPEGATTLATLHLPLEWYPRDLFRPRPGLTLHAVSPAQHATRPPDAVLAPPIGNGVPEALFETRISKRGFALALGRICPEKGFDHALRAAHAADRALLLGGEVQPYAAHRDHFREQIAPLLDRRRRFLGPLDFTRKRRLLAAADALLVPSLAPETASLVAMEALASGTPVIAYPNGALADVVEDGTTGFLVRDEDEMAAALRRIDTIDPRICRARARARFGESAMIAAYLALYDRLAEPARPRRHARTDLTARAVTNDAEFASLEPAWWALWRACPNASPFQSPAFLIPWRRHFRGGPLTSAAVYEGDRLVALAPFWLETESARLLPLGISLGDRLDVLVAPDRPDATVALVEALAAIPGWERLVCEEAPPGATALALPAPAGGVWHEEPASGCPTLALTPEDADTLACVPAERRRKLRRAARLADAAGGLAIRARDDDPDGFFADLVALHEARWHARGEPGVVADAPTRAFHTQAIASLAAAGLARLWTAEIGGRRAAAFYGLHAKGRAYAYLGGFDPAFAHESPGALLMAHAIRAAAREKAEALDLLRGREPYKYAFGAVDRANTRRTLVRTP